MEGVVVVVVLAEGVIHHALVRDVRKVSVVCWLGDSMPVVCARDYLSRGWIVMTGIVDMAGVFFFFFSIRFFYACRTLPPREERAIEPEAYDEKKGIARGINRAVAVFFSGGSGEMPRVGMYAFVKKGEPGK